jgi:hypothetical protein
LVVWNMNFMTFHILGMSSSQLLLTHIFQRGRLTTNHIYITSLIFRLVKYCNLPRYIYISHVPRILPISTDIYWFTP